jgi:hypothetical protein
MPVDDWAEHRMCGYSREYKANGVSFDTVVVQESEGVWAAVVCSVRNLHEWSLLVQ